MKDDEKQRLFSDDGWVDADGKIIPTPQALRDVETQYPHASAAEKWRLAIAATLISKAEVYFGRSVTMADTEAFVLELQRFRGIPKKS